MNINVEWETGHLCRQNLSTVSSEMIILSQFWPLLMRALFFEAAEAVGKIVLG
jgi:hypothetical protein